MTEKQFFRKFHGVIAPKFRGAPYPKFDRCGINEKNFFDDLRVKNVSFDFSNCEDHDELTIDWMSQLWDPNGISAFLDEVKRCFTAIKFNGIVYVKIYDRDGEGEENHKIDVVS